MSKKNRAGLVLLAGLLTFGSTAALASCGEQKQPETPVEPDKPEQPKNTLVIKNEAALKAEWHVGDEDRKVELDFTPAGNVTQLINSGAIKITSSDKEVISVLGAKLTAKKDGKSTITVTYGDATAKVEITVLPKEIILHDTIQHYIDATFDKDGKFTKDDKLHGFDKLAFVCKDSKGNFIVTDGTDFLIAYSMTGDVDGLAFGDNVSVEGKIGNYFAAIEITNGHIKKLATKDVKVPTAVEGTDNLLYNLQKTSKANNNGPVSKTDWYEAVLVELKGLEYIGGFKAKTTKGKEIHFDKYNDKALEDTLKGLKVGDTFTLTGSVVGYNARDNYYNVIPTACVVTEHAIQPTSIALSITAPKLFETIKLNTKETITMAPEGAKAIVTFKIEDTGKILNRINGDLIMATKPGTVKITPIANEGIKDAEVVGEAVTLEIPDVKADNAITRAETKTLAEIVALNPTESIKDKLFKTTVTISDLGAEDDKYGNIKVKDGETEIQTYGLGNQLINYVIDSETGNIKYMSNPKIYADEIRGKLKVGDQIELYVYVEYKPASGNKEAKICYNTVLAKMPEEEKPELPEVTGTKVANYDLSEVSGTWPNVHFKTNDELKALFTNTVTENAINVSTVEGLSIKDEKYDQFKGIEKSILDQGPKTGGLKLGAKPEKTNKDGSISPAYEGSIKFTFADNKTADKVVLNVAPWFKSNKTEAFTLDINGTKYEYAGGEADINTRLQIVVDLKASNTCTITMKNVKSDNRAIVTAISFFNN